MIFRKNRPEEASTPETPETPVTASPTPQSAPPATETQAPAATGQSILTSDVVMEGNLVTSGDLHLDGTVHGAVQAQRVVVDANGAVSGQVVAQEVEIRGRVIGPICAVRVKLVPGAQVEGDVMSQSISVDEGAFIDGQIRHSEDPLGEWQQMWYGEEAMEHVAGQEEAAAPQPGEKDSAELAPYLRPEKPATSQEAGKDAGRETDSAAGKPADNGKNAD